MAALRIEDARPVAEFQRYVSARAPLPAGITALTGISDSVLLEQGIPLAQAMQELLAFLDGSPLLCYNAPFDQAFLLAACQKCGLPPMTNRIHDTLILARPEGKRRGGLQANHARKAFWHRAGATAQGAGRLLCGL